MRRQAEQVPNAMLCKSKITIDELTKLKQACDLLLANLNN